MSDKSIAAVRRIVEIHTASEGKVRPHFILTGPSGSGKTWNIQAICDELMVPFYEINCASLTKEGLSGNSLSKAMAPIANSAMAPCVVFFDEFDKMFISGNSNDSHAHESTNGIQNEMLKMLESQEMSVYTGNYGQYQSITVDHCLFIFAGAFNGEADITLDRLRDMGLKTEFLGRVGLAFSLEKVSLEKLLAAAETSELLGHYLELVEGSDRDKAVSAVQKVIRDNYEHNTLGFRMINTLYHQYFITGTLEKAEAKQVVFTRKLAMPVRDNLFEN